MNNLQKTLIGLFAIFAVTSTFLAIDNVKLSTIQFGSDDLIVEDGKLTVDRKKKKLDDSSFQELLNQIKDANDFQETITELIINVQTNKITKFDISPLYSLTKLQKFELDVSFNEIVGGSASDFSRFEYLNDLNLIMETQGYQGTYDFFEPTFIYTLRNADFMGSISKAKELTKLKISVEGNRETRDFLSESQIAEFAKLTDLEVLDINLSDTGIYYLKGFSQFSALKKLKEFYLILKYSNVTQDSLNEFGLMGIGLTNIEKFEFIFSRGWNSYESYDDLNFLNNFQGCQKINHLVLYISMSNFLNIDGIVNLLAAQKHIDSLALRIGNIKQLGTALLTELIDNIAQNKGMTNLDFSTYISNEELADNIDLVTIGFSKIVSLKNFALTYEGTNITNIVGVERFSELENLESLYLGFGSSDLLVSYEGLQQLVLPNLVSFEFENVGQNSLVDITAFNSLPECFKNLENLNLQLAASFALSDISPLAACGDMNTLKSLSIDISQTDTTNITPILALEQLTNLEELYFRCNFTPLSDDSKYQDNLVEVRSSLKETFPFIKFVPNS